MVEIISLAISIDITITAISKAIKPSSVGPIRCRNAIILVLLWLFWCNVIIFNGYC